MKKPMQVTTDTPFPFAAYTLDCLLTVLRGKMLLASTDSTEDGESVIAYVRVKWGNARYRITIERCEE